MYPPQQVPTAPNTVAPWDLVSGHQIHGHHWSPLTWHMAGSGHTPLLAGLHTNLTETGAMAPGLELTHPMRNNGVTMPNLGYAHPPFSSEEIWQNDQVTSVTKLITQLSCPASLSCMSTDFKKSLQ